MTNEFHLSNYDYRLPPEQIAQYPVEVRDASRLMVLDRETGSLTHTRFSEIWRFLREGDCLVLNNSKVFPARINGRKPTGGKVELFLLHYPEKMEEGHSRVLALYRSSKPVRTGAMMAFGPHLRICPLENQGDGQLLLDLFYDKDLDTVLQEAGQMPLPPYIRRKSETSDTKRYQTVYASTTGSVAAPTAGLHFTESLLSKIKQIGVDMATITLHVGYGTFAPVRCHDIRQHKIHSEWVEVKKDAAKTLLKTKNRGGRIIAVGTTSVRTLEFVHKTFGCIRQYTGPCDLYILPGYRFRLVDAIVTNFHLPKSSLLILVCAFAGRKRILSAYRQAIEKGYRFYSYGDAMLIT